VAATLNNLAGLYSWQGEYAKAEPLYLRAIAILEKVFPNGHPNLDTAKANYATNKPPTKNNKTPSRKNYWARIILWWQTRFR
jgi:hypothetical protein